MGRLDVMELEAGERGQRTTCERMSEEVTMILVGRRQFGFARRGMFSEIK